MTNFTDTAQDTEGHDASARRENHPSYAFSVAQTGGSIFKVSEQISLDMRCAASFVFLLAAGAVSVFFRLPPIYPAVAYAIVVPVTRTLALRWQVIGGAIVSSIFTMGGVYQTALSSILAPEVGVSVCGLLLITATCLAGLRLACKDRVVLEMTILQTSNVTLQRELDHCRSLQKTMFEEAPIPMMLEDWSGIRAMVRELRASGVTDWDRYFESHPEFFPRAQQHHIYLDANQATIALFGAKDKESFFRAAHAMLPKAPTSDSGILRAMIQGDRDARGERRIQTPDGKQLAILWQFDASPESTTPILFLAIDITVRLDVEEALSTAQAELTHSMRAAVLGEMVASVTHEVNQPLAATSVYAEAALRWLGREIPDLDRARLSIQKVVRSAGYAAEVVEKVKGFVRKEVPEYRVLEVKDILMDTELIVQREARKHRVELRFELQGNISSVRGVKVQVQQVLVNLIVNAVHAVAGHDGQHRWVSVLVRQLSAQRVAFEVRDSGPGISDNDLERVFEPFFSTKTVGLGLGLPICRRIVEAHRGAIRAVNHASGASFIFELEAVDLDPQTDPLAPVISI